MRTARAAGRGKASRSAIAYAIRQCASICPTFTCPHSGSRSGMSASSRVTAASTSRVSKRSGRAGTAATVAHAADVAAETRVGLRLPERCTLRGEDIAPPLRRCSAHSSTCASPSKRFRPSPTSSASPPRRRCPRDLPPAFQHHPLRTRSLPGGPGGYRWSGSVRSGHGSC